VPPARAHLEYTLYIHLAEIEPPIWRRIVVPANLTLHQLHQVLQVTMGWTHSHLHQCIVSGTQESIYYGEPSPVTWRIFFVKVF
jgi:Plasmid pRiA4b ORF-3-like protein